MVLGIWVVAGFVLVVISLSNREEIRLLKEFEVSINYNLCQEKNAHLDVIELDEER